MKKLPILLVISLIFSNLEVTNNKYYVMITESKVTEIFCIADDFCKEYYYCPLKIFEQLKN